MNILNRGYGMSILNNVGKSLGTLSQEAKKTYDTKKLERRIKNYRREETELYINLGRLIYKHRGIINSCELEEIYNDLDIILARMKQLDKQIANIRRRPEDGDTSGYLRLDRKESDLTITRTDEGIKLVRSCPACKTANSSENDICMHCGRAFK